MPGRSSIYRALVRHRLIDPTNASGPGRTTSAGSGRASMELWQMDIVGRLYLADGTEVKVVTGVDDHSRYCVCARIVARATATPVCEALAFALRTHGAPERDLDGQWQGLHRIVSGQGQDRCSSTASVHNNGIRHLLTAPYSPTTTGKVERFHRTYRDEFFAEHDRVHATIDEAQAALDAWVHKYNTERPHQSLGDRPPIERFALAGPRLVVEADLEMTRDRRARRLDATTGRLTAGWTSAVRSASDGFRYRAGTTFAGEPVEVVVQAWPGRDPPRRRPGGHPRRTSPGDNGSTHDVTTGPRRSRPPTSGMTVIRSVDQGGSISFAGASYRVGRSWGRQSRRGGHRGRIGPDLGQGQGYQGSPDPTRPLKRARRLLHAQRPAPEQQRRLMGLNCQAPTGANVSSGYRGLTVRR